MLSMMRKAGKRPTLSQGFCLPVTVVWGVPGVPPDGDACC